MKRWSPFVRPIFLTPPDAAKGFQLVVMSSWREPRRCRERRRIASARGCDRVEIMVSCRSASQR